MVPRINKGLGPLVVSLGPNAMSLAPLGDQNIILEREETKLSVGTESMVGIKYVLALSLKHAGS